MNTILIILAIIFAIPIGLVVLWNALKFLGALIGDLGGLIWAVLLVGIISFIVFVIL